MLNEPTNLYVFDSGAHDLQRYRDVILEQQVRILRRAVGPDFIFMDDTHIRIDSTWCINYWKGKIFSLKNGNR